MIIIVSVTGRHFSFVATTLVVGVFRKQVWTCAERAGLELGYCG